MKKHSIKNSQIGGIGDNWIVNDGITIIKKVTASPIGIAGIILLLAIIALANLPAAREQLPAWLQPRTFPKEQEGEVLIVVATFDVAVGDDPRVQDEICQAIKDATPEGFNLRPRVVSDILRADDRDGAKALGDRYDASLVIWGTVSDVRITANFFNRKDPESVAADVEISETEHAPASKIEKPSAYIAFVTENLPGQLTFLSLFAVGQSYYAKGEYAKSAQLIEASIKQLKDTPIIEGADEAYFRLGWLYQIPLKRLSDAELCYSNTIKINPNLVVAYNNLGAVYDEEGKYEQALSTYSQTLELNRIYLPAYFNRGNTYRSMGKYRESLADFDQAIKLAPNFSDAHNNRGLSYYELDEYEKAIADFNRAIELDSQYAKAYNNRGSSYNKRREYNKAIADFNRAIELNSQYAEAYANRGRSYNERGEYDKASADFTRVREFNFENAKAYANRGWSSAMLGRYDQAISDYNQAIAIEKAPGFYYNGASIHALFGHTEEACNWLKTAIDSDPKYREFARTDLNFDSIRNEPCFQALMNGN